MNTITTVKIARPPHISESEPCPVPLNNTFILKCQALYTSKEPVSLAGAKIYFTIKSALTDLDASAKLCKNSTSNATYFSVDAATLGLYTVIVPAGDFVTATMSADTNYYIDTEIILASGRVFTHIYDTIRMFQQTTKATT